MSCSSASHHKIPKQHLTLWMCRKKSLSLRDLGGKHPKPGTNTGGCEHSEAKATRIEMGLQGLKGFFVVLFVIVLRRRAPCDIFGCHTVSDRDHKRGTQKKTRQQLSLLYFSHFSETYMLPFMHCTAPILQCSGVTTLSQSCVFFVVVVLVFCMTHMVKRSP